MEQIAGTYPIDACDPVVALAIPLVVGLFYLGHILYRAVCETGGHCTLTPTTGTKRERAIVVVLLYERMAIALLLVDVVGWASRLLPVVVLCFAII